MNQSTPTCIERVQLRKQLPDRYRLDVDAKLYLLGGNERPYFSVTAEMRNLRRSGDNQVESCGCLHDDVLANFPELKPVVDLHLADDRGIPMHAIANGEYWLGYNLPAFARSWRVTGEETREAADYVRSYVDENRGYSTDAIAILFFAMLPRWQAQADHAVATIRRLREAKS